MRVGAERAERPGGVPVVVRAGEDEHRDARPDAHASAHLDLEALDQRVREQLLAHPLHLGLRLVRSRGVDLEIDEPADARSSHREAELAQRPLHRLALRVEDPFLRPDENGDPHLSTTCGSAR